MKRIVLVVCALGGLVVLAALLWWPRADRSTSVPTEANGANGPGQPSGDSPAGQRGEGVLPTPEPAPVAAPDASYADALTQAERDLVPGTEDQVSELDAIRDGFAPEGALPVVSDENPHLAIFTDPTLPLDTRVPEDFRALLYSVDDPVLREGLLAIFMRQEEDIMVRHEAANVLIASGDALAPVAFALVALDRREDPRIRGYAIQHLENAREAGRVTARDLRPLFRHVWEEAQDEELRREALLNAARAEDETILYAISNDPGDSAFAGMEDVVMQVWLDQKMRTVRLERQALNWLQHGRPEVQAVACHVVGVWQIADGVERLKQLKQVGEPVVKRAAEAALAAIE